MSVLIKGMEMPKACVYRENGYFMTCPLYDVDGYCKVLNREAKHDLETKLRDCPLIPFPPHGRLGDLDKLIEKIDGIWDCNDMVFSPNDHCCNVPEDCKGCKWIETKNFIRRMVANAQTIIPAEETNKEATNDQNNS